MLKIYDINPPQKKAYLLTHTLRVNNKPIHRNNGENMCRHKLRSPHETQSSINHCLLQYSIKQDYAKLAKFSRHLERIGLSSIPPYVDIYNISQQKKLFKSQNI